MKSIKKRVLSVFILMLVIVFTFGSINVYAATEGEPLSTLETGWRIIDDSSSAITYEGEGWTVENYELYYNGGRHACSNTTVNPKIKFNFTGTKLLLVSSTYTTYSDNIEIKIDNEITEYFFPTDISNGSIQMLTYVKEGLEDKEHFVEIAKINQGAHSVDFVLDAVGIGEGQELISYNGIAILPSPVLVASSSDSQVQLSWGSVADADSYTVKRATNSGGPYTIIAESVTSTSYTDTTVTNGDTYYYVVTTVNTGGESGPSNEASATPETSTPVQTGSAILVINMIDGVKKEYDLTMTEVNAFIDWYDTKDNGTGDAYYIIEKTWNNGPFASRKDYIIFDKICFFEVNEY